MKTKEQVEKALAKWQKLLEEQKQIMEFEEQFITAGAFMEDKATYVQSVKKYHEAEKICFACEKLITHCKWILDIE